MAKINVAQLASARLGTDNPTRITFLCLDEKLVGAALREGFNLPKFSEGPSGAYP